MSGFSDTPLDLDDQLFDFGNSSISGREAASASAEGTGPDGLSANGGGGSTAPELLLPEATPDYAVAVQVDTDIAGPHHDGTLTFHVALSWSDYDV